MESERARHFRLMLDGQFIEVLCVAIAAALQHGTQFGAFVYNAKGYGVRTLS
jgi:hypothetical protein